MGDDFFTCMGMLTKGSISVISWTSDSMSVYYVDEAGDLRQKTFVKGCWEPDSLICSGRAGSPVSMLQSLIGDGFVRIRVYYLSADRGTIEERCWDGKLSNNETFPRADTHQTWSEGALSHSNADVAPNSKMAAVVGAGGLSLFYQNRDGWLGQHYQEGSVWKTVGLKFLDKGAMPSEAGIAAVSASKDSIVYLYLQSEDGKIYEGERGRNSWLMGGPLFQARKGTPLCAVMHPVSKTIYLVYVNEDGYLTTRTKFQGSWGSQPQLGSEKILQGSSVAIATVYNKIEAFYSREVGSIPTEEKAKLRSAETYQPGMAQARMAGWGLRNSTPSTTFLKVFKAEFTFV